METPLADASAPICSAHLGNGEPCSLPAAKGSPYCAAHRTAIAGRSPVAPGLYEKALKGPLREKYLQYLSDPDILTLVKEIALLRTHFEDYMERCASTSPPLLPDPKYVNMYSEVIRRLVESEAGKKYVLTVKGADSLVLRVAKIVGEALADQPGKLNKVIAALRVIDVESCGMKVAGSPLMNKGTGN